MSSRMLPWIAACLSLALVPACGEPSPATTDDASESASSTGEPSDTTGTTAIADSTADSTTGVEWEAPLARGGIVVDWVQANQGVGVRIGADGGEVGPTERAAPLIQNRVTLVRAFWTVPDDWIPRELEGRLIVRYPDGMEEVFSNIAFVESDAFEGDLHRTFYWGLMADQTVPGIKYRVELYETTPDYDDLAESDPPPMLPVDGSTAYVGIEDSYLVLKAVVVPFVYDNGAGCSTTPDTSPETMQLFKDLMYQQNPIDRLDFEVHEPIVWDTPLANFGELHSFLVSLRIDEDALPETYYYGLVDVCAGGLNGAGGQANGIPSDPVDPGQAYARVSAGLSLDPDWSAETFVHEIGHSQGRRHVACDGEGGPDPTYPHDGGDVGEWGFGVIDFGLRHPTFYKDYMTYCHPTWVGTWGWNKVYPVIRGLSEWDAGFPGGAPKPEGGTSAAERTPGLVAGDVDGGPGTLIMGTIGPDGGERWITIPGRLPDAAERGPMRLEMRAGNTVVASIPAHVQSLPDGDGGTLVVAPLPRDWSAVTEVTRVVGSSRSTIPRAMIGEHHRSREIQRVRAAAP
ncbi:zinc metalloprotease [Paraliomyxa miuraensis]|uniref:hypothetical protein n=1 Tax=Paraliomyxa miuraensis TaxID=376150 RepID=UPI00224E2968|nr:hypothetical protein [Paraliomyxa miuraensis]MCX4245074.1 hypothetical protein [Paraliomyxa miuraensis]